VNAVRPVGMWTGAGSAASAWRQQITATSPYTTAMCSPSTRLVQYAERCFKAEAVIHIAYPAASRSMDAPGFTLRPSLTFSLESRRRGSTHAWQLRTQEAAIEDIMTGLEVLSARSSPFPYAGADGRAPSTSSSLVPTTLTSHGNTLPSSPVLSELDFTPMTAFL
jgi:hypothetical protein